MKRMRKIFAILMTMAMVMGVSITGFAAKNGASITVSGLSTAATQNVTIYELYRLDDNDNAWVPASWIPAGVTIDNLTSDASLQALETAAAGQTGTTLPTSNGSGSVTFNNVQAGAYLVLVTDTENEVVYSPMIAVTYKYGNDNLIAAADASVVAKAESYTTEKSQNDSDQVVEVGDLITYTITTTVPYVENGNPSSFTVTDTLTGATYYLSGDSVKGVSPVSTVTVGGSQMDGISIPASTNGGTTFTLDLSSLLSGNAYAGQQVVITYTARVSAVDEITNKAGSTNDPNTEAGEGETKNYTGQMTITKLGEEATEGEGDRPVLQGATFAVYRMNGQTKEYAVIDSNGYITGEWIAATGNTVPSGAGTVTTGADGTATVKGLDVGTYYFDEVAAPDGYSINTSDAECKITKDDSSGSVVVSGSTTMNDTKISALPSTGGMGTTIFTIAGCVIMISAAGLFFASRRKVN